MTALDLPERDPERDAAIQDLIVDVDALVQVLERVVTDHRRLVAVHRALVDAAVGVYATWAAGAIDPVAIARLRDAVLPLLPRRDGDAGDG